MTSRAAFDAAFSTLLASLEERRHKYLKAFYGIFLLS